MLNVNQIYSNCKATAIIYISRWTQWGPGRWLGPGYSATKTAKLGLSPGQHWLHHIYSFSPFKLRYYLYSIKSNHSKCTVWSILVIIQWGNHYHYNQDIEQFISLKNVLMPFCCWTHGPWQPLICFLYYSLCTLLTTSH